MIARARLTSPTSSPSIAYFHWAPDGDIKLRPRTFTAADADQLTTSSDLFAREFNTETDAETDILEAHPRAQNVANWPAPAKTEALPMLVA